MNKIDTFSIKRLWMLIRYEVAVERPRIIALLRTFTIVMALPFAYGLLNDASYSEYCGYCLEFFGSTQSTMLIVYSATIFNIIERSGTNYLMLPASNSEKLTAQVLLYSVGTALLFLLTYAILECLHYPIVQLLGKPAEFSQSIAPLFFDIVIFEGGWPAATIIILSVLTIYNLYVNIRCRGYNWFIGSIAMIILSVIIFLTAIVITDFAENQMIRIPDGVLVAATALILSVLNYYVWRNSLKNFKKLAII